MPFALCLTNSLQSPLISDKELIQAIVPEIKLAPFSVSTIRQFSNSDNEGAISVFETKNYFWDLNNKMLNKWPEGFTSMNTKFVEPTKMAAHCMYGSRVDIIGNGNWVTEKLPYEPELITIPEIEAFDIDESWQFKIAEILYEKF